jgi:hypothetical protein
LSGVARAAIGWAGPQAKSQGGRAGQAAWFPRGHTTRPVPSPPRRTSPSFFGNLLGGTFGGSGIAYPSQQQHRVLGHASPPGLVLGCIGAGVPTSGCCPCPCQKCVTANKKTQARREAAQGINARMGNRPLAATLTLPSPRPHARPGICSASHSLPMPPTLTDGADPTACTLPHALLSALPLLSVSSNGAPCYSQLRPVVIRLDGGGACDACPAPLPIGHFRVQTRRPQGATARMQGPLDSRYHARGSPRTCTCTPSGLLDKTRHALLDRCCALSLLYK